MSKSCLRVDGGGGQHVGDGELFLFYIFWKRERGLFLPLHSQSNEELLDTSLKRPNIKSNEELIDTSINLHVLIKCLTPLTQV